ncbi:MAG TPA: helix-turn-helix domain-containing protein [Acidimicrobiales bacterium]|nr:helix-turn-helix domain-containing protein [Acidimicrobiales bacterium]
MARPAPGADRSVAVLDLMATHPDERFTLSEVARRCGLNKATAHALLSALSDHGILLRHPAEKRYSLGPRLVAIGEAARRGYSAVDFVQGVLDRLAADTGLPAQGWRIEGDSLVSTGQAGTARARNGAALRLPLSPPLGAVFMAWSDGPTTQAWLARAAAAEAVQPAVDALPAIRARGFGVTLASPEWSTLVLPRPSAPPAADASQRALLLAVARQALLPAALDGPAVYRPAEVAAPVFGSGGRVDLVVSVATPEGEGMTGSQLADLGRMVVAAADALTASVRGHRPPADPAS